MTESDNGDKLTVTVSGKPGDTVRLVIAKPGKKEGVTDGVENREVTLDAAGKTIATFDQNTVNETAKNLVISLPATAKAEAPSVGTGGDWRGRFGKTAAWVAGVPNLKMEQNGFKLATAALVYVYGQSADARVAVGPQDAVTQHLTAAW